MKWLERYRIYCERKRREYWETMTEQDATAISRALFHEFGAVEAGDFMDTFRARGMKQKQPA